MWIELLYGTPHNRTQHALPGLDYLRLVHELAETFAAPLQFLHDYHFVPPVLNDHARGRIPPALHQGATPPLGFRWHISHQLSRQQQRAGPANRYPSRASDLAPRAVRHVRTATLGSLPSYLAAEMPHVALSLPRRWAACAPQPLLQHMTKPTASQQNIGRLFQSSTTHNRRQRLPISLRSHINWFTKWERPPHRRAPRSPYTLALRMAMALDREAIVRVAATKLTMTMMAALLMISKH